MRLKKLDHVWLSNNTNEDNVVVLHNNVLYRYRGSGLEYDEVKFELSQGRIHKSMIGLPLSYLNQVEYRESDPKLKFIYQRASNDIFTINDEAKRKEIFDSIINSRDGIYDIKTPGFFKRTRAPLIALGVVLIGFLLVILFIIAKEQGTEFESVGLLAFLIYFAEFGLLKNTIGFSFLIFFLAYRIWYLNKKNSEEVHVIKYR